MEFKPELTTPQREIKLTKDLANFKLVKLQPKLISLFSGFDKIRMYNKNNGAKRISGWIENFPLKKVQKFTNPQIKTIRIGCLLSADNPPP